MAKRAVVTGCAGFIGSHLIEALLADGHTVLGVDCFNDNYARADKRENLSNAASYERFRLLTADLVNVDAEALLDGADVVYHLAGEPGVRASWGPRFDRYTHHNVHATQRLLEAARDTGVRFVYASSSSVYGDALSSPRTRTTRRSRSRPTASPSSPPSTCACCTAPSTASTPSRCATSASTARASAPTWPSAASARRSRPNAPIEVFGDGRQTRDFTYVADVVAATRAAGETRTAPGRVFNIGGGNRTSLRCALEVLAGIAGPAARRPLRRARVGRRAGHRRGYGAGPRRARLRPRRDAGGRPRRGAGLGARAHRARAAGEKLDGFLTFSAPWLESGLRYPGCAQKIRSQSEPPRPPRRLDRRARRTDQPARAGLRPGGRPRRQPRQALARRRAGLPARRRRRCRRGRGRVARRRARGLRAERRAAGRGGRRRRGHAELHELRRVRGRRGRRAPAARPRSARRPRRCAASRCSSKPCTFAFSPATPDGAARAAARGGRAGDPRRRAGSPPRPPRCVADGSRARRGAATAPPPCA